MKQVRTHALHAARVPGRRTQQGVATLAVVSLLMLLGALAALTSSRVVFFSQKAATGAYHYEQARQAAQAGIDRALAQLSHPGPTTPNRNTYLDESLRLRVGLTLQEDVAETMSRFIVTLAQPTADLSLLEIRSTGCTETCAPTAARTTFTQLVKLRSLVIATPDAALTARRAIVFGGNISAHGDEHGAAVRSGEDISFGGSSSAKGLIAGNEIALRDISREAFFSSFFGDTHEAIRAQVPVLEGQFPASPVEGGIYWVEGDTAVHGGQYGTAEKPVVVIVNGNLTMNANTRFFGLLYVVNGWNNSGGGNVVITGAAVSELGFSGTGTPDFILDRNVLSALSAYGAPAKVPGSWRDF